VGLSIKAIDVHSDIQKEQNVCVMQANSSVACITQTLTPAMIVVYLAVHGAS